MSERVSRRSFNLRKTATGVDFQIPINFEETFKDAKPPVIPPLIKSICEEIISRIATRQLSILPGPLSTLFSNADALAGNLRRTAEVDEVIKLLHSSNKGISEKQRMVKRKADLEPYQTSVITRAMFRYIELSSDGLALTIEFPANGYLILGPPPSKNDGKPDVKSYTRSLDSFISKALSKNPIKRDIFCYFMQFLSQLYQLMGDGYRSEPALCGMTRYLLASRFANDLINLHCTECSKEIKDGHRGCKACSYVTANLKPPYRPRVINILLEYVPMSYWKDMLTTPRGGFMGRGGITTKLDDLKFVTALKLASDSGDTGKKKNPIEPLRRNPKTAQKLASHGSTENNGIDLQNVEGPRENSVEKTRKQTETEEVRRSEIEGNADQEVVRKSNIKSMNVGGRERAAASKNGSLASPVFSRKNISMNLTRSNLFITPKSSNLNVPSCRKHKKKEKGQKKEIAVAKSAAQKKRFPKKVSNKKKGFQ
ncbi:unnamed protein product [Mesocestoides corti]|uniref:Uncharacterized protein n=1 Tax=Mesocestoides corti TaxID=53468 RepID=A0A0R3UGN9_MESCO|nr:unnamed protein product [Mesocestoides corti]